ncbi:hypothetical protein [Glycocaulis sp.]|uniref:hypothetical protein n=1 Tax=Glycocaulis sp. TaxID=1969725 RepID=UPI003D21E3F6
MRKARTTPLIFALLLAPAIAGTVGGALVWLALSLQLMPDNPAQDVATVIIVGGIAAVFVGVIVTYALGAPVILAGWLIAHFMKWRSPAQMGVAIGVTGMVFAFLFFLSGRLGGEQYIDEGALIVLATLPCGFAAGFLAGWAIGNLGYEMAPDETVSPGEA